MRKRFLSLLLSMAMSVCLVCALSAPAYAVVAEDVNASATTEVVVESTQPVSVLEEEPEQTVTAAEPVTATEEETDSTPLTPDGNSNLQDDSKSKNKEFITIQSKNGRYYYLVIDRDRADNNAYLLSQIDEGDLKEFLEEEEITEPVTTIVEQPAEKSEEEEPKEDPKPTGNNSLTFLLLAAAAGGGFYYFKVLKPKQEQNRGEREIESAEFPDDEVEREDMDDTRVIMTHTPYAETGDEEVED